MSRRAAARHCAVSESVAVKWLERVQRHGSREPVAYGGHRAGKLMPHREFLEDGRAEKWDVTVQALCDRLSGERGVKADTPMMSRLFRKIGVTFSGEIVSPGLVEGRERLQHWSVISVQHLQKVLPGAIAEVETRGSIAIEDVVACGRLAGAHEAREAHLQ
jgi:hypothetical protein